MLRLRKMGKYCKLVNAAIDKGEGDAAWEVAETMMNKLEKSDPVLYDETMMKLEKLAYKITKDEAEQIVRGMRPKGQHWTYKQVVDYVQSKGATSDWCNWYLVMNMVYNDYYDTARMYGLQEDIEFYYGLANNFINDPDAKFLKVEKYFME